MEIKLVNEPLLEFGDDNLSSDPKLGLSLGGFFSLSNNSHRSEIHYGIIGSQNQVELARNWIQSLESKITPSIKQEKFITHQTVQIEHGEVKEGELQLDFETFQTEEIEESQDVLNQKSNPTFPGFTKDSCFNAQFVNDSSNNYFVKESAVTAIIDNKELTLFERSVQVAELYISQYRCLLDNSFTKPNVCLIVVSPNVYKTLHTIPLGKGKFFNFRRYLKSRLITIDGAIPVQLTLENTLDGTRKGLQDKSMQAWNFVVANYYKSLGIPWTLSLDDKQTCFIGVSFHKVFDSDSNLMKSSIAQAFNYEGKGIVFIGNNFEWDYEETNTKSPHLTYEYAKNLIKAVLNEYKMFHRGLPPARVVIHKTTDFWNSAINKDYAEVEGLKDGIREALGEEVEIDLVTIKNAKIKLLRTTGQYPVLRGTLLEVNKSTGVLYTTGYIPYFETYPGVHIPQPIEVSIYEGESTLMKVCQEIMGLTKMNFNNCNYFDSIPITIRFAQRVGQIAQYFEDDEKPPNKYYFYM